MKYYSVYFKRNSDQTITPIKVIEHDEAAVKTVPFLEQRLSAAQWAKWEDADVFAFYTGKTGRASMFFNQANEIDSTANSAVTMPVSAMRINAIKKIITSKGA